MSNILSIKNVSHGYRDGSNYREVLSTINYDFEEGCFYAILGASGSGKTTLLSLMAGLDKVQSGDIYFKGEDIQKISLNNYRRDCVGVVFQQYNLFSYMNAVDNILVVMDETKNKVPKNKVQTAYGLLEKFGITKSKAKRLVTKLSGGEQQRVAIARALAGNVDLIFADEPTGNLDQDTQVEIMRLFRSLAHDFGKTVIVVTHSIEMAKYSDKKLILTNGALNEV